MSRRTARCRSGADRLGTGQPLLTNSQTAVLAPFHLGTLGLEPTRAMSVAAALQTFVLLAGADLLALALGARRRRRPPRRRGRRRLELPCGLALSPAGHGVRLGAGLSRRRRGAGARHPRAAALAVAAAFGMMASGQPQIALYASLAGGAAWSWIV